MKRSQGDDGDDDRYIGSYFLISINFGWNSLALFCGYCYLNHRFNSLPQILIPLQLITNGTVNQISLCSTDT
jgi:hypothetical protein